MWKTPRRHSVDSADSSARHSADSDIVVSPLRGLRPHCLANLRTWTSSHCHSTYLDLVTMSRCHAVAPPLCGLRPRRITTPLTHRFATSRTPPSLHRPSVDSCIIASSLHGLRLHCVVTLWTLSSSPRHSADSDLGASSLCRLDLVTPLTWTSSLRHSADSGLVTSPLRRLRRHRLATPPTLTSSRRHPTDSDLVAPSGRTIADSDHVSNSWSMKQLSHFYT